MIAKLCNILEPPGKLGRIHFPGFYPKCTGSEYWQERKLKVYGYSIGCRMGGGREWVQVWGSTLTLGTKYFLTTSFGPNESGTPCTVLRMFDLSGASDFDSSGEPVL